MSARVTGRRRGRPRSTGVGLAAVHGIRTLATDNGTTHAGKDAVLQQVWSPAFRRPGPGCESTWAARTSGRLKAGLHTVRHSTASLNHTPQENGSFRVKTPPPSN